MSTINVGGAAKQPPNHLVTLERLLAIQATELKPAMDEASTLIAEAVGADKVDVFLFEPATTSLVAVGTSSTPLGLRQHALGLARLPLANGGRSVEVFQTGQVHQHGQVDTDLEELRGVREALGVRSTVIEPLEIGGVRRGVIETDSAQPDAFSAADRAFLDVVTRWVGLVIQRAELVEQLTREAAATARRQTADDLLSTVAHDMGNVLTPLLGRAYLVQTLLEQDNQQAYLPHIATITRIASRLQRMLADLLDTGRLDQGLFAVTVQPVDLAALVRETAAILHTSELPIEVRTPEQVIVEVDSERLRQALENLLSNARNYSPPGAPIVLSLTAETQNGRTYAVVTVQDRGPGIAPDLLPHLFERFVRDRRSRGLGLGLYMVHSIAIAHGGSVTVQSAPGQGTTFRLAVPVVHT